MKKDPKRFHIEGLRSCRYFFKKHKSKVNYAVISSIIILLDIALKAGKITACSLIGKKTEDSVFKEVKDCIDVFRQIIGNKHRVS